MNENKGAKSLNRSIPLVLCFFLVVSFIPLIRYPSSLIYDWYSQPLVRGIYWAADGLLYLIYALWVWLKNKVEPPLRYSLLFLWVLFYAIALVFIHDKSMNFVDPNGLTQTFRLDWLSLLFASEETLFDLLSCFAFLFLWPYGKKEPKFKNVLLVLLFLIASASFAYGFVRGADPTKSYPYYTSFFASNEDFGKVAFLGVFASALLAYDHPDWRRWFFLTLTLAFVVLTAWFGLAMTFWCLIGASLIVLIFVYVSSSSLQPGNKLLRLMKRLSLLYVLAVVVLVVLILVPSALASQLRLYLGESFREIWQSRMKVWSSYLNGLSSWRIFLGDGLMGYYRASLLTNGIALFTPFNNGPMDVFNGGGVVFLLFYLLVILVGFNTLSKNEGANSSFLAIVVGFSCAFLIYTIVTDERLLFSSNFMSLGFAYLFTSYPAPKKVISE